ncbi:unnamed protein product [Caenorhabditis brenneri]
MPFPLRRIPLLAIREIIKSMDTRAIFFFSLVSKKSANFVMLSIPKYSLSAEFVFKENGFLFELMPKDYIKQEVDIIPVFPTTVGNHSLFTRFSFGGLYVNCEWTYFSEVEESVRNLFYNYSRPFKNSKINMKFEAGTKEEFAMEIMRFAWDNGFPLENVGFRVKNAFPESIQELLNRCNEQHMSLHIGTQIPMGFKCTPPPGGYKFKSLSVNYAHWVNLDDFLQCRKVIFTTGFPDLTVEYLNDLLKKIVNLECRLQSFLFHLESIKTTDFTEIVEGLSESEIEQGEDWQELEFERKDGLKLLISLSNGYLDLEDDY